MENIALGMIPSVGADAAQGLVQDVPQDQVRTCTKVMSVQTRENSFSSEASILNKN